MVDVDVSATSTEAPRIGRYSVLRVLGEGAMGTVYAAYDEQLDRRVAVKVIRGEADASRRARMVREGQAMARLSHPNVVPVFEVGEHDASLFLAMEFVEGQTLREWSRARERPWHEVVPMFAQAARGLHAAHEAGILHRDFKPDNVIVGEDGRVRVLDFGVSRAMQVVSDVTEPRGVGERASFEEALTETGAAVGTPAYMAPEQFMAEPLDERTDVFAFCVALFEALFGTRPYVGKTRAAVLDRLVRYDPETPPERGVPGAIVRLVMQGIRPKPDERPQSMQAVLDVLDIDPHRGRKRVLGGAAVLSIAGLAGVGGALSQPSEAKPCEGLESSLAGVWDDDVRADVRAAFEASTSPLAERMWSEVESELDERAAQWLTSATDACTATRVTQTQSEEILDATMACLAGPLREMRELTDVLRDPDLRTVALARDAVEGLADAQMCENLELLRSGVAPPPDADAAAQVEAMRETLAKAGVLLRTGHPLDAAALVEPLVEEAEALGYVPLQAEVAVMLGRIDVELGKYRDANLVLTRATLLAEASRHDVVLADAAIDLLHLSQNGGEAGVDAERWDSRAGALVSRLGGAKRLEAKLAHAHAELYIAKRSFDRLDKLDDKLSGPTSSELRARAAFERGVYVEASRLYAVSVDEFIDTFGESSTRVARVRTSLAMAFLMSGDFVRATEQLDLAIGGWATAVGELHPELGTAYFLKANIALANGEADAATGWMRRAANSISLSVGTDHPRLGEVLNGLGALAFMRGDYETAERRYREALRIAERSYARPVQHTGNYAANLGEALMHRGRLDEALMFIREGDKTLRRVGGGSHPDRALALKLEGYVHLLAGRPEEARRPLNEALRLVSANRPYERGGITFGLALAHWRDEPSAARAFAEQSASMLADEFGTSRRASLTSLFSDYSEELTLLRLNKKKDTK